MHIPAIIAVAAAKEVRHWLFRLGGPGMILVALIDNSFIPLPGSLDVFTIIFTSHNHKLWFYYVAWATLGSVIGAYVTYRLGQKGGRETLEKKIGHARAEKVYKKFENAGFSSVMIGVMLPPPFPVFPVLLAAGTLQYPAKKFLSAIAIGRAIRFTVDALLGIYFGRAILGFFAQYYKPALYTLIVLAVLGGIGALIYYKHWKHKKEQRPAAPQARVA